MENNTYSQKYKFKGDGLTANEKKIGKKLFEQYRDAYNIDSASDFTLLEELVYRELRQKEIKEEIYKLKTASEGIDNKNSVPANKIKALDENLEQIMILKDKLCLFEDKDEKGVYEHIKILEKKFKKWREENQASLTAICPHCSDMILFMIKTEAYDAIKHPFFSDKVLANKHLWKLYKEEKITKLDVAKVLQGEDTTSIDYVDWLEKKIYKD